MTLWLKISAEKSWNDQLIRNIFNNALDVENILNFYIPCSSIEERKIWTAMKGGELSSRSAYSTIHNEGRGTSNRQINWKSLWRLPPPQGVLFFS